MSKLVETTTEVKSEPRFSVHALIAAFLIGLLVIVAGVLYLTVLLPSERVDSTIEVVHEIEYGENDVTVRSDLAPERPSSQQTIQNERSDRESWAIQPSLVPVSSRATIYALLLVGALLLAAGVTLSLASLTTTTTTTTTKETDDDAFLPAETTAIPVEVITETVNALAAAKPPNLVVLAGVASLALGFGLALNSSPEVPPLPEVVPALAPRATVGVASTTVPTTTLPSGDASSSTSTSSTAPPSSTSPD